MKKKGFIYFLRQYGLYLGIVLLGFSLFGLSVFWAKRGEMVENNFIPRAGAGGVDSSMELYVKGLGEEEEALRFLYPKENIVMQKLTGFLNSAWTICKRLYWEKIPLCKTLLRI